MTIICSESSSTTPPWVESIETLINPTGGDKEGVHVDSQPLEAENEVGEKKDGESGRISGEVEVVRPSVKDTSCETSYKSARTHSSIEPTVAEVLAGLKKTRVVTKKEVRLKKRENQVSDDDVVIVSSTASRRRTRSCAVALEKKKTTLGLGGEDVDNSVEPSEVIDLEEMERKAEKNKRVKKGKGKAKRPSEVHVSGFASKKRRGVVISDPKSPVRRDMFVVDDAAESYEEGITKSLREREVPIYGTYNNQKYIDILQDAEVLSILSDIGPHWPQLVKEFVCNVSEEIADPASSMFHKLGDIVRELTGKAFTVCPSKGQLQASACSSLSKGDSLGEDAKSLTISDKLMKGKHVIDVEFNAADHTEPVLEGEAAEILIKAYEEEKLRLEAKIQVKKVRVSELQEKIQALKTYVPPTINDPTVTLYSIPTTTESVAKTVGSAMSFFSSSGYTFLCFRPTVKTVWLRVVLHLQGDWVD
ncbi:hypothetical protein LIER_28175 [Lithospermum erythrorhizon]|uniref:Uncharacterized protein n=1 Tax=Lithospermum erythrorhizon TaxID=34254 RepID=A0AAV3REP7_LITER